MPLTANSTRDSRIDWLRGLALISIFVNHMPGNRLENWTSRNIGFSDAAEVFVLLAGVAASLAFFRKFEAGESWRMSIKALRRAGVLYAAHIAVSLAAMIVLMVAAKAVGDTAVYELIGASALFEQPIPGLIGLATGGFQLGYFNILPLYVVLLMALPLYLLVAKIDPRLMLAASAGLYAVSIVEGWQPFSYPDESGWFFNPFAWQLLYATGVYLGILKLRGQSIGWHPAVGALACAYMIYGVVWVVWSLGGHITYGLLPGAVDTLAKSNLPMSRYLHVMAAAYLLVHSPVWSIMTSHQAAQPTGFDGAAFAAGVRCCLPSQSGWIPGSGSDRPVAVAGTCTYGDWSHRHGWRRLGQPKWHGRHPGDLCTTWALGRRGAELRQRRRGHNDATSLRSVVMPLHLLYGAPEIAGYDHLRYC